MSSQLKRKGISCDHVGNKLTTGEFQETGDPRDTTLVQRAMRVTIGDTVWVIKLCDACATAIYGYLDTLIKAPVRRTS
jgi:hypothetical protein